MKRRNHIKVGFRKLGRERAMGQAVTAEKSVELDPRLRSRALLATCLHECLHCIAPEWSEHRVEKASQELTRVLWALNFRRLKV